MNSDKVYKVIIVGAGISGLSAANFLYRNGIEDILILEAKEKAGGRIDTTNFGNASGINGTQYVELGAQWIHGEDNDLCRLVKASNHRHHKFSWEGKGDYLLPNGEKADESIVTEILDWLESTIEHVESTFSIDDFQKEPSKWVSQSPSMGKYLKTEFLKYLKGSGFEEGSQDYDFRIGIFQWGMSFQRIDNSCNQMTNLSLFRWSEFEVNPGEHYNNFKKGASSFLDEILVGSLPKQSIRFNSPVEKVDWNAEKIELLTKSGKTFTCDTVLITCSIGVLKEWMNKNLFDPPLPPRMAKAIQASGFGPVTKIYLQWDTKWWPQDFQGVQFLWPDDYINCCDDEYEIIEDLMERWPKSITGFDPVLNNPNVLLAWLGGPEAVFVESLKESEIGERCAKILRDFTKIDIPDPDTVLVSKWNTDEFIRGAYSYRSVEGDEISGDISSVLSEPVMKCTPVGQKVAILFSGEALSKSQYSTLHGAFETGERQAAKLIAFLQRQTLEITPVFELPKHFDTSIQLCSNSQTSISNLDEKICSLSITNKLSQKVAS